MRKTTYIFILAMVLSCLIRPRMSNFNGKLIQMVLQNQLCHHTVQKLHLLLLERWGTFAQLVKKEGRMGPSKIESSNRKSAHILLHCQLRKSAIIYSKLFCKLTDLIKRFFILIKVLLFRILCKVATILHPKVVLLLYMLMLIFF